MTKANETARESRQKWPWCAEFLIGQLVVIAFAVMLLLPLVAMRLIEWKP